MGEYEVKLADEKDAEGVLYIRNLPLVRAQSIRHQEEITLSYHLQWFEKKYLSGTDNYCFVLKKDGVVIGYCRCDSESPNEFVISIALDPQYHGQGLGRMLLHKSLAELPKGKRVSAIMKKDNQASLRFFQKEGFILEYEDEKNYHLNFNV